MNVRFELCRCLRPNEWLRHLDRHLLLRHRSSQRTIALSASRHLIGDFLLLDITADLYYVHIVRSFQVIFHVKLVEVERDPEGGISGREKRRADEGEGKVWPAES